MQARLFGCAVAVFSAVAFVAINASSVAMADDEWPTKPIRVIVPLTPGSAVDVVPRIVLEEVS